ncbi:MAG: hypothetical protein GY948_24305 [Alphaproteobacteria bacterium]|nr:hypothetical protein [Alphaproteobacteria bacterium]
MPDLYDVVAHYAGLGDHRTGTKVDAKVVDWLAGVLQESGAEVTRHRYEFSMFKGDVQGMGAAEGIHLEPLYYSAAGSYQDSSPLITTIAFDDEHGDAVIGQRLDEITRQAQAAGATLAVAATLTASGGLCAINRPPALPGQVPICLAPGRALAQLRAGRPEVHFQAGISSGRSENLTAFFSCTSSGHAPLVITTPLTGWFACAGERGTGIAIAISLAQELSKHVPVLLVMPTGHELGYYGAAKFVDAFDCPVCGVLHLGSCIADKTALAEDGAMRAVTNLKDAAFEQVCDHLGGLSIRPEQPSVPTASEYWIGESELWAPRGDPMISIAGTSDVFHTPEDRVEVVTNSEILNAVRACVFKTAQALIR